MQRGLIRLLTLAAAAIVIAPATARADGYVSPWVAANTNSSFNSGRGGFGVGAGDMGASIFGGEVDFGWSPSFLGTTDKFGNNSVIDLMGNVMVARSLGNSYRTDIRPYVTAGMGLLRTQVDGGTIAQVSSSKNDPGWNVGAGVMGFFSDHVGIRGDVRYLRTFTNENSVTPAPDFDPGGFHFWRTYVGVVIR